MAASRKLGPAAQSAEAELLRRCKRRFEDQLDALKQDERLLRSWLSGRDRGEPATLGTSLPSRLPARRDNAAPQPAPLIVPARRSGEPHAAAAAAYDDDLHYEDEDEDDDDAAEAEAARRLSEVVASERLRPDSILAHLGQQSRWFA